MGHSLRYRGKRRFDAGRGHNAIGRHSLRENFNGCAYSNPLVKFFHFFIGNGNTAECPVGHTVGNAHGGKMRGEAVDFDVSAGRYAELFGTGFVAGVGVRDAQVFIICAVRVLVVDGVASFRRLHLSPKPVCVNVVSRRVLVWLYWLAVPLVLALISYPYVLPWIWEWME